MSATRAKLIEQIENLQIEVLKLCPAEAASRAELALLKEKISELTAQLRLMPAQDLKDPRILRS